VAPRNSAYATQGAEIAEAADDGDEVAAVGIQRGERVHGKTLAPRVVAVVPDHLEHDHEPHLAVSGDQRLHVLEAAHRLGAEVGQLFERERDELDRLRRWMRAEQPRELQKPGDTACVVIRAGCVAVAVVMRADHEHGPMRRAEMHDDVAVVGAVHYELLFFGRATRSLEGRQDVVRGRIEMGVLVEAPRVQRDRELAHVLLEASGID